MCNFHKGVSFNVTEFPARMTAPVGGHAKTYEHKV